MNRQPRNEVQSRTSGVTAGFLLHLQFAGGSPIRATGTGERFVDERMAPPGISLWKMP